MKKIFNLVLLMVFIHFFLLEAFFANLEMDVHSSYQSAQSGWAILLVIDVFVIALAITGLIIIAIYEKYTGKMAKIATYLVLFSNCIYLFYWQSTYERQMFTRPERFETSSIVIILIYFVFELFLTFYVINRLYKSEDTAN
jgi:predicted permease